MKQHSREAEKGSIRESLVIAFSMYSRIPMPQTDWSEAGMKYALCFFPLVGAVLGAVWTLCWTGLRAAGFGMLASSCILTALPILVTGGIHMDGFLDTIDARSSCQSRERKLEILKDSHAGAFAIIGCGVYLLLYLAAVSQLMEGQRLYPAAASIFVMSRALSGWSVVAFPKARQDGLAASFSDQAKSRTVKMASGFWYLAGLLFVWYLDGVFLAAGFLAVSLAVFFWYRRMALREFGGVTGDLAGYFLQQTELLMMVALAFGSRFLP